MLFPSWELVYYGKNSCKFVKNADFEKACIPWVIAPTLTPMITPSEQRRGLQRSPQTSRGSAPASPSLRTDRAKRGLAKRPGSPSDNATAPGAGRGEKVLNTQKHFLIGFTLIKLHSFRTSWTREALENVLLQMEIRLKKIQIKTHC